MSERNNQPSTLSIVAKFSVSPSILLLAILITAHSCAIYHLQCRVDQLEQSK
jgi:hypothetical protein